MTIVAEVTTHKKLTRYRYDVIIKKNGKVIRKIMNTKNVPHERTWEKDKILDLLARGKGEPVSSITVDYIEWK